MPGSLSPRRARSRQRKEAAIIDVAMRLVDRHGIDAVTVARIAAAMDWSVGTMYRYFPSKDALLAVLQAQVLERYRDALSQDLPAMGTNPLHRIIGSVRHCVAWFSARPGHWALIGMGLAHPRPLVDSTAAMPMIAEALGIIELAVTPIDDGTEAALFEAGDGTTRALVLWAHVQGVLQMRKLTRFAAIGLDLKSVLDLGLRSILVGWGAPRDAVDAALAAQEPA